MFRDINEKEDDSEIRDRDRLQKQRGKEYGDRKRRAEDSQIIEGDKVYVKEMEKTNKLTSHFNPTPHTVEKTVGGDVTIRNEDTGQMLRRNVIHLKKIEGQWKPVQDESIYKNDPSSSVDQSNNSPGTD